MNILLDLFLTFARIGGMTYGGGYAMLPVLQREIAENKGWATDEELADYYAIGQCTPGIIAVNTATFVGQKRAGTVGGIVATLGLVFPSLIIITLLAGVIVTYSHLTWVQHAFAGIRVCVCVLIANSVVKLHRSSVIDRPTEAIFVLTIVGAYFTDLSPVWFVLGAGLVGVVLKAGRGREKMMLYLQLFFEFFKTGLFAVGGGMATIPFLYDISDKTGWFTHMDLANMLAVSESTPGPIGINMATYVGFVTGQQAFGFPGAALGAVVATVGLITPSIAVILVVASFLKSFRNNFYVESAFYGLRPASTGLIGAAGLTVIVANLFFVGQRGMAWINWKGWTMALILWVLTNVVKKTKKIHPILFILVSAVAGILFQM